MTSPTAPAWQQNWRDPSAYPQAHNFDPHRWPWEFVRRSPRYQRIWDRYMPPRRRGNRPAILSKKEKDQVVRNADRISRMFGLNLAPPPECGWRPDGGDSFTPEPLGGEVVFLARDQRGRVSGTLKTTETAIVLQEDMPLQPQLDAIRSILGPDFSRPQFRARPDRYPYYLRTLDAVACDAPPIEIARVLYPNEHNSTDNDYRVSERISRFYTAACELRDGDYKKLAWVDWSRHFPYFNPEVPGG
jgi:hypothetical protein